MLSTKMMPGYAATMFRDFSTRKATAEKMVIHPKPSRQIPGMMS